MTQDPGTRSSARERILDAAVTLFADRGFAEVSVGDIAAETGTSTALIYYHFKDKQELMESAVFKAAHVLEQNANNALAVEGGPTERLMSFVHAYSRLLGSQPVMMRLLVRVMSDIHGPLPTALLQRTSMVVAALAEMIADGVRTGEFREVNPVHAAAALFALINTPITARAIGAPLADRSDSSPEEVTSFMAELFFRGVQAC